MTRISPREMAERASKADRIIALPSGVVRLETGNWAEVFVPYEWVAYRDSDTRPKDGDAKQASTRE